MNETHAKIVVSEPMRAGDPSARIKPPGTEGNPDGWFVRMRLAVRVASAVVLARREAVCSECLEAMAIGLLLGSIESPAEHTDCQRNFLGSWKRSAGVAARDGAS